MNDEKWDELEIEQLLEQAPKIQDNRSKEDVLARLKQAGALDDARPSTNVVKKKNNLFIGFGISAAILMMTFSSVYFLSYQTSYDKQERMLDSSTESNDHNNTDISNRERGDSQNIRTAENINLTTSVYPNQLEDSTAFLIELSDKLHNRVPVTIVIPNTKILEDFGTKVPSEIELYNQYASSIHVESLGFTELYPLQGENAEQSAENSENATKEESKTSMYGHNQHSFFLYEQADGTVYSVPDPQHTFHSVKEALHYMKTDNNAPFKTAIIQDVDYTVEEKGEVVEITFSKSLDVYDYEQQQVMRMIEGMLLTAGSFNKQVRFNNIEQQQWEGFDFSSPLPIPIGANKISVEYLENY